MIKATKANRTAGHAVGVDVKNLPADRQVSRHKVIKISHCLDL
jgi:hypothetical protein